MRISKIRFKQLWRRLFFKKCCLSCKHFDAETIKCIRVKGEEFSIKHYYELVRKKQTIKGIDETLDETSVGSACPNWE